MRVQNPPTAATMQTPVPLIEWDRDHHRWFINQLGLDWLRTVPRNTKVIVVAGPLRSGKSYLLNELAQLSQVNGFPLGSEFAAKTQGIWIFVRGDTVFFDTEGLFDPDHADANRDAALFTLSVLLGSYFVFNTKGVIDEQQIRNLNLFTQITDNIHLNKCEADDGSQLHQHFPPLLWLLRDSFLQLSAGVHSPKQYFEERVLKIRNGFTSEILSANATREAVKAFFPQRDCATLPIPTANQEDLQNLATVPKERISPEFLQELLVLVQKILHDAPIKGIKNGTGAQIIHPDGQQLADYLTGIVDSINNGGLVGIEDNWEAVSRATCERALTKALQIIDEESLSQAMPLEGVDLEDRLARCHSEAIISFQTMSMGPLKEEYERRFKEEFDRRSRMLQEQNMAASSQFCTNWLTEHLNELRDRVNRSEFPDFGSYETELRAMCAAYDVQARGPAKHDALATKQHEQAMLNALVQTKFQVKQAEMQAHQERMQNLVLNQKTKDLEAQQERAQQQAEERHREFVETLTRMQAEQGKSHSMFIDSIQKQKVAHDEQIKKLIADGQTERAELMTSMRQTIESNNAAMNKQMEAMQKMLEQLKKQPPPPPPVIVHRGGGGGGGGCLIL